MGRIKTIAERIDEMIASYEKLNREAHEMFDLYIDQLRLECPGTPMGSLKQLEITERAGSSLNVPRALQILKERKCSPSQGAPRKHGASER
jgi:hypothetical protein